MFFPSENGCADEALPVQGLTPREDALLKLRQICKGLLEDFGTIRMGVALHTFVEKQREACLRLGITVDDVNDIIAEYHK